ncbi:MAG: cupin domain-containing protein [Novosphingobium sp.]|nr:cupin domain-containing protein [Novosphingobium sp.]
MKVTGYAAALAMALPAGQGAANEVPLTPGKGAMEYHLDVPRDHAAQHVEVVTRDIPPGGEVPWHTHPGVEIAYLVNGTMVLDVAGAAPRTLNAGESFLVKRNVVHGGRNAGSETARLVITYVTDKDSPLRMPAPKPEGY